MRKDVSQLPASITKTTRRAEQPLVARPPAQLIEPRQASASERRPPGSQTLRHAVHSTAHNRRCATGARFAKNANTLKPPAELTALLRKNRSLAREALLMHSDLSALGLEPFEPDELQPLAVTGRAVSAHEYGSWTRLCSDLRQHNSFLERACLQLRQTLDTRARAVARSVAAR